MYKNYIFDLYGTLIHNDADETSKTFFKKFTKWLRRNGYAFHYKEFMLPYMRTEAKHRSKPSKYTYPEIAIEPVFREVFQLKGYCLDDEQLRVICENFRRIATKRLELYPDTLECLKALKAANKNIYLLSNAQRSYTWPELQEMGLLPFFDGILISSDEKCMKPDKAFFDILFERYGLKKEESIMIGNEIASDILGANGAGIDSLYVNRYPVFKKEESTLYTYVSPNGSYDCLINDLIKK